MGKLTFGQTGLSYQCDKVELKVEGAPKCPRCHQRVYFNEEKKAAGKTWHAKCFTCGNCKKSLDSSNYNQHNGDQIYCTNCYRRLCGPQVYGFVAGAVLPTRADFDSKAQSVVSSRNSASEDMKRSYSSSDIVENPSASVDDCGRCGKRVYFAEEVRVGKKKWHKHCLRCGHCSKSIEPGKCSEHDSDLFCQSCYARFFGPRGYGYAAGNGSIFSPEVEQQDYLYFNTSKSNSPVNTITATTFNGSLSRNGGLYNGFSNPNSGFNNPNSGFNNPNSGFNNPNNGSNNPNSGFNSPNNGYKSPNNGYNSPNDGYNSLNDRYKYNGSDDGCHGYNSSNGYGSNSNIFYNNKSSNNMKMDNKLPKNEDIGFNNYGTKEWTEYHRVPTSDL